MKKILFILFFLPFVASAQIPGNKVHGPITLANGLVFNEGDTLNINAGTSSNGDFRYIYQPANYWIGTPQKSLDRMLSNTHPVIKHFKEFEHKKIGKKTWAVINLGGLNAVVELEPAVNSGEITVKGFTANQSGAPVAVATTSATSSADELLKFKKLLDAGAITQAEYDAKKKQLLGL